MAAVAVFVVGSFACEVFQDPTPEFLIFHMNGTPGTLATAIYSKEFVIGISEDGTTRVQLFGTDTVAHTLPIDTVIDIRFARQLYIQVDASPLDTLDVTVTVDIDDRNIFDDTGKIYPDDPWQYLYVFNRRFANALDVVF